MKKMGRKNEDVASRSIFMRDMLINTKYVKSKNHSVFVYDKETFDYLVSKGADPNKLTKMF